MDQDTIAILKTILEDVPAENEANAKDIFKSGVDEKAQGAITGLARLMSSFKDVLRPEHIAKAAELAGMEDIIKRSDEAPGEDKKAAADGSIVEVPGKITVKRKKAKNKDEDGYEEEEMEKSVSKSEEVPAHIKDQLEQLWKSNAEAVKKAEMAEAKASKLEAEAMTKSLIIKAEKEYSNVPGTASDLGVLLKSLHDQDPETAVKVEALLKSADSALGQSDIFKEYGSSRSGGSTVNSEIDGLAKEMVSKSENSLSYAQAYVKAMDAKPELYSSYLQEHPKQVQ